MIPRTLAAALVAAALVACSDSDRPDAAGDGSGTGVCYGNLDCRVVEVPQVHGTPGGATIGLKLVIGHAKTAAPGASPIIYLEGGPGGTIAGEAESGFIQGVADSLGHDFVLLEQRGNTLSRPALNCNITDAAEPDAAAVQACTAKYAQLGYRIETFNTIENAHDIEDVRVALGVPKVILWGGSYGGELAQTAARLHPDRISGMLLESSAMSGRPYRPFEQERARPVKLAAFLTWLSSACPQSARCAAAMPNLDAAKELETFKASVSTTPFAVTNEIVLNSADIAESLLLITMYSIPNAILVLRMMYAANHDQLAAFDQIRVGTDDARTYIARIIAFASVNRTSNFVYDCYDTVLNWTDAGLGPALAGLYPTAEESASATAAIDARRKACGALPPASVPQTELAVATVTSVPTIFFHGGLDWPTPAENVISDAGNYSRAQVVTVPCAGHGIQSVIPQCFASIASTFFQQADANSFRGSIDASCAVSYCEGSHDDALFVDQ